MLTTGLVILLIILNILDGGLTLYEISSGIAIEANPIMSWLMEKLGYFWLPAKISFVTSLAIMLGFHYNHRMAAAGLWLTNVVYLVLLVHHLKGIYG